MERKSTGAIILMLVISCALLGLLANNAPVATVSGAVLGFVVPGYLILSYIDLSRLTVLSRWLLVFIISLVFLMFFGLLANEALPTLGIARPLEPLTFTIVLSLALAVLYCLALARGNSWPKMIPDSMSARSMLLYILILAVVVVIVVAGMSQVRLENSNLLIVVGSLVIIGLSILVIALGGKWVSYDRAALATLTVSIAFISVLALRTDSILGADAHYEYSLFRSTIDDGLWSIQSFSALDSCLSISLLPAISQGMMSFGSSQMAYKLLYASISALIPLVGFELARLRFRPPECLAIGILLATNSVVVWASANPRTMVAILLFATAVLVLFLPIKSPGKNILFIVLMMATVVSHYTTAYIFFFLLVGVWIVSRLVKSQNSSRAISLSVITAFFVFIFLWCSQITEGAFNYSFVGFFEKTISRLGEILTLESRGGAMPTVLGSGLFSSNITLILTVLSYWVLVFVVVIGLLASLATAFSRRRRPAAPHPDSATEWSPLRGLCLVISICAFAILVTLVVLPQASTGLGTDRALLQLLVVLSISFVLGCYWLSRRLHLRPQMVVALLLVPIVLSGTGLTYALAGVDYDPSYSQGGTINDLYSYSQSESSVPLWLHNNGADQNSTIWVLSAGDEYPFIDSGLPFRIAYGSYGNESLYGSIYLGNGVVTENRAINKSDLHVWELRGLQETLLDDQLAYTNGHAMYLRSTHP